ncbi:MAG TPA: CoA-acylating methylmalonate-semialdehyde dehydrogenase [Thermoleophilaceae bacterium]|nr:CoA-acylating methylmalonate-semialdehyde dehydrogenase [Thermoleophilaceae bacterium]
MAAQDVDNFVDGRPAPAPDAERLDVLDPARGDLLGRVPLSGAAEVGAAVASAARAWESWRDEPVTRRARRMFGLQVLLEEQLEDLAKLVTLENGKHLDEARGELRRGIEVVELAAAMTTLMKGETLDQVASGVDVSMHRFPLGVVCGITPFNFPGMIPLWFAPLAIAAGNTFVLKPSQRTPLTAMRIAELFAEAGFPDGVLNVVHGAQDAVEALIDHPEVRAVSFVGSAPVARKVYERAGLRGKRVQALAGAKNHLVVMPDADLSTAVPAVFSSAFSNAGQRCLAGSVAVAVGGIGDALAEDLAAEARHAMLAPGDEPDTNADMTVTPVTTREALDRITGYIQLGEKEGARLLVDGRGQDGDGFFLGPTLFDDVQPDMAIAREEIFGPVLALERMDDLGTALEVINSSEFGNAAAIFTRDGGAARRFVREVQAGMVGVNVSVPAPVAYFPFSGWRGSFYGDLHATGRDGVEFYTEKKVVTSRWP